jgi:hypothetical protein
VIGTADGCQTYNRAFQVFYALVFVLCDDAEERRLDTRRDCAHRQAARRRANHGSDELGVVDVAAQQRGHRNVWAHLNELDLAAMFGIKATIFRHEGNEKRQGTGGDRDTDFSGLGFSCACRAAAKIELESRKISDDLRNIIVTERPSFAGFERCRAYLERGRREATSIVDSDSNCRGNLVKNDSGRLSDQHRNYHSEQAEEAGAGELRDTISQFI